MRAVYDTTGASAYDNALLDFGTAAKPAEGSATPMLTVTADNTDWAKSRQIRIAATGAKTLQYRKPPPVSSASLLVLVLTAADHDESRRAQQSHATDSEHPRAGRSRGC